jgi:hypothetical protein
MNHPLPILGIAGSLPPLFPAQVSPLKQSPPNPLGLAASR